MNPKTTDTTAPCGTKIGWPTFKDTSIRGLDQVTVRLMLEDKAHTGPDALEDAASAVLSGDESESERVVSTAVFGGQVVVVLSLDSAIRLLAGSGCCDV